MRRYLRAVEQEAAVRDRALALVPYYAGARDGEVVRLDVDDVRLSARKGELRILGKGSDGGKLRTVPVHPGPGLKVSSSAAVSSATRRQSPHVPREITWSPWRSS